MNVTLIKAAVASVPVMAILSYAVIMFQRRQSVWSAVQLTGAAGFAVVVVAHICEALHLLPSFGWGQEQSVGHYIDLSSAILGITLLPVGYMFHRRERS
jgi:uncharacterized membrane protein